MPGRTVNNIRAESSRKRNRPAAASNNDEDQEQEREIVQVERASSSLRGDTRKRARLSSPEPDNGRRKSNRESTSTSSDDEEAAGNGLPPASPDSPAKTQYELMRDNNFEHLRHEAADDQRATQRLRFRPNLLGDNAVADNGIIESITCVNFMCHVRLHCELGPLLNFIVGENGSGKSAILTAITLCLGGKASSTNRGGSLKTFVKEGTDRAVLAVKIKNQGQDAYKQDVYGDSIIVERHFSRSGTSGFKVKTALGQTFSTKKQEVEEIVEYYALQVDNPLNVLSQDNARQFLNASTKTQKYKFFIEGVQLQQLDNDYRLISESLEQMVAKVPDQEERVVGAKAALEKANRMKEAIEGNRKIRIRYRTLRHQMVWAQVVEEERELASREKAFADAEIKVAEAQREAQEKKQLLELANEKIDRAKEAVATTKEDEGEYRLRVEKANDVFNKLRDEVQKLHVDEREAHMSLKSATENLKDLEQKIAAEQQRLDDANGEAHSRKLNELELVNKRIKELENQIVANRDREPELINQAEDSNKALAKVSEEIETKRGEIHNVQTKIKTLEQNRGSLYDGYEAKLPDLLKAIANEKGFNEKPIGPLGSHIKLLKPQWSPFLEKMMGQNLNAFLVSNQHDRKLLYNWINRLNIKSCPVLIGNRHPLNISGKEPDENFDTVLRVLKFDDLRVRDQLIINHMIEQVILVPERVKAQEIMFSGAPPRNVKVCLAFHDLKRNEAIRMTVNNGNYSSSPMQPNPHLKSRMKTDTGSELGFLKDSLQLLESDYRHLNSEKQRLSQEGSAAKAEILKLKKNRTALDSQLRHTRVDLSNIEGELDQFDGIDGRLQGLREQLGEMKESVEHHGMQYGTLVQLKQERNALAEEARRKLKEEKIQLKGFEARLEKVEDKVKRLDEMRRIALIEVNEAVTAVELFTEDKVRLEGKRDRQKANVEAMTAQAQEVSPTRMQIEENETYKSIEKQYEALGKRLKEEEKKNGMSDQQVNDHLVAARKALEKAVGDLESIKEVNSGLRNTLNLRLEKWRKFQRYISSQSRANFIYLLSERGFRGKLLLDHERKALDLQVEPDRTEKRAAGRNTKTLSGGEKSFSSICLLLSVWEAMGSPLRCLDEFDVFMDNVNRAISTNMLITAARRSVNRQYIFITPNAIEGSNTLDRDVKIIRLTDPRQRTLVDH
ncbi:hypothetical protein B0T17DRAFT_116000 [Bombardia bombarda]|uniref:RecF/RecN/SMC N-terminal domain-containing protein n=1 Tax=Bombardia bombarda TaxID=252184 RepID=A0AA39WCL8_9PEZI|nr:hypothetical protein B0T17DRAFT_116000 [Bombardia bombarda]